MLKHVSDRSILDTGMLPAPDEVRSFFASFKIPDQRIEMIAGSYENKLSLLEDFQNG